MGFPFACPKCKNSWSLSKQEFDSISKRLHLICRECGNKFDILNGVTEIITTDNLFLQYALTSNHILAGKSDIIPGQVKVVNIENEFSEIHKIFLTVTGPLPLHCIPVKISNSRFLIISSKYKERQYPEKIEVSWLIYGNKLGVETPLWRQLLANSKGYEIDKNFRMEIVELATTFEVFLIEYLRPKMQEMFADKIVKNLFARFKRMDYITTTLFEIATGEPLKETLRKAGDDKLYGKWKKGVNEERNRILHQGQKVSSLKAKKAFETVFKIIVLLEPEALEYLYTSWKS